MVELPAARPLVVDEAYFEYGGETALHLLGASDVIVVRTFSKAFGLASARVGYALADASVATELNDRQQPAPVSTLGGGARVGGPRGGRPMCRRRSRSASASAKGCASIGLEPLPSYTNFVLVPHERAQELYEALLGQGLAVRPSPGAIRVTVHRPEADDRLLEALAALTCKRDCVTSGGGCLRGGRRHREPPDATQPCACLRSAVDSVC